MTTIVEIECLALAMAAAAALGPVAALVGGAQKVLGDRKVAIPWHSMQGPSRYRLLVLAMGAAEALIGAAIVATFPSTTSAALSLVLLAAYLTLTLASRDMSPESCGCLPRGVAVNLTVYRATVFSSLLVSCILGAIGIDGQSAHVEIFSLTGFLVGVLLVFAWIRARMATVAEIARLREGSGLRSDGITLFISLGCEGCIRTLNAIAASPALQGAMVLLAGHEPKTIELHGLSITTISYGRFTRLGLTALPALALMDKAGRLRWQVGAEPIIAWINNEYRKN